MSKKRDEENAVIGPVGAQLQCEAIRSPKTHARGSYLAKEIQESVLGGTS